MTSHQRLYWALDGVPLSLSADYQRLLQIVEQPRAQLPHPLVGATSALLGASSQNNVANNSTSSSTASSNGSSSSGSSSLQRQLPYSFRLEQQCLRAFKEHEKELEREKQRKVQQEALLEQQERKLLEETRAQVKRMAEEVEQMRLEQQEQLARLNNPAAVAAPGVVDPTDSTTSQSASSVSSASLGANSTADQIDGTFSSFNTSTRSSGIPSRPDSTLWSVDSALSEPNPKLAKPPSLAAAATPTSSSTTPVSVIPHSITPLQPTPAPSTSFFAGAAATTHGSSSSTVGSSASTTPVHQHTPAGSPPRTTAPSHEFNQAAYQMPTHTFHNHASQPPYQFQPHPLHTDNTQDIAQSSNMPASQFASLGSQQQPSSSLTPLQPSMFLHDAAPIVPTLVSSGSENVSTNRSGAPRVPTTMGETSSSKRGNAAAVGKPKNELWREFEADSTPFETVELMALNDIAALKDVLSAAPQPAQRVPPSNLQAHPGISAVSHP
ncbi:hypothetical protein CAOG_05497 [Capsaspora owczarzaki ATCC 30864]|uniref:Uncharacterized protein n=1 Tax=Capsaspora owczarzaki (strain ATCC 30864) TaxID=595528 RepID=A0A0D2UIJ8_CAPO3|nr:hypothetical protein CAOG_05497 [Capsaspora owczarzaki ATCC 30864]KJE94961.1 hypothetical protein CAOG_005497 [Capsaspora owczarzaki ATCC 30864]|eukprot:XP_004346170.1 hypothetical protein CAOG_05497 [Capsaspora owczarzaki ATCC 30864]